MPTTHEPSSLPVWAPQPPARSAELAGARRAASPGRTACRPGWVARVRHSQWSPLVARGILLSGVMLGFAALGASATSLGRPGVQLATQATPTSSVVWLAPTPPASTTKPAQQRKPTGDNATGMPDPEGRSQARLPCARGDGLCDDARRKQTPEGLTSDGKVILNVAGADVLTRLPGVGARRAEAIIKLRERLGRFRRASDLLRVRGIGVKSLKRMLPHLVLDPPAPDSTAAPKVRIGE